MGKFVISSEDAAIQYLKKKDKRLCKVIDAIGDIECNIHSDAYSFIVDEIIGQMLSNKVADVISTRFSALCYGNVTVENVSLLTVNQLRGIGLSNAKSNYILTFTDAIRNNIIDLDDLSNYSDSEVIGKLTSIRGIGTWTSKMFLIFILCRPDVLPYEDGAFMKSYKWLYKVEDVSPSAIKEKCKKWCPYSSIAARYLYRALDMGFTKKPFHLFSPLKF